MSRQQVAAATQESLASVGLGEVFHVTEHGLEARKRPTYQQCEELWEKLFTVHKMIQIALGDAMVIFRELWGEKAEQIVGERTGWAYETSRNYSWVAEHVPQEVRRFDKLSFSHHQIVAKSALSVPEKKHWLDKAADSEEKPWTTKELSRAIKANADPQILAWCVRAEFTSEAKRDEARRYLEGLGGLCTTSEKRG